MIHFAFLVIFCAAVGAVLGAMLRRDPGDAVRLGAWIAAGMLGVALAISWVLYFLPL